jgi:hypothetical protein
MTARLPNPDRWWLDRFGTVWLNKHSVGRRPLTLAELVAITEAVEDFVARNGNSLDAQDTVN